MNEIGTHTIEKLSVDVYSDSMNRAKSIEKDIEAFIQDMILPVLTAYLDELEKGLAKKSIQIPEIFISLDLSENDFSSQETIQRIFMNQLKEVLSVDVLGDSIASSQTDRLTLPAPGSYEDSVLEISGTEIKSWIYFFENGKLPWWYSEEKAKEAFLWPGMKPVIERHTEDTALLQKFLNPAFFDRLVTQYAAGDLEELIWLIIAGKTSLKQLQYRKAIKKLPQNERLVFLRALLLFSVILYLDKGIEQLNTLFFSTIVPKERKIVKEIFREVIKFDDIKDEKNDIRTLLRILDEKSQATIEIQKDVRKEVRENFRKDLAEEENKDTGFYISRAGLILLHPFLKAFFKDCGWTDAKGGLINPEMAVHALYYLGTKEEQPFDFEVVFEKYLLGMPLGQPIKRDLLLTKEVKGKTEKLMGALKENWQSLGSTGIETVRNEFINRKGKLVLEENNDRLFVERKAQDILLSGIPFNISLIKLPWHQKYLLVDW